MAQPPFLDPTPPRRLAGRAIRELPAIGVPANGSRHAAPPA